MTGANGPPSIPTVQRTLAFDREWHGWGLLAGESKRILETKLQAMKPEPLPGCEWVPIRLLILAGNTTQADGVTG